MWGNSATWQNNCIVPYNHIYRNRWGKQTASSLDGIVTRTLSGGKINPAVYRKKNENLKYPAL